MKNKRSYVQLSRAWYGALILQGYAKEVIPTVDQISIMVHGQEFMISWKRLGMTGDAPQLEVFSIAWNVLVNYCADLLKELAKVAFALPSPDTIVSILDRLGFEDKTQEVE